MNGYFEQSDPFDFAHHQEVLFRQTGDQGPFPCEFFLGNKVVLSLSRLGQDMGLRQGEKKHYAPGIDVLQRHWFVNELSLGMRRKI